MVQTSLKVATTTLSFNPSVVTTVGTLAIVTLGKDNTTTVNGDNGEVLSVVDTGGNTWSKIIEFTNGQGAVAAGATVSVWRTIIDTALSTSHTVTFQFASNTAKAVSGWRFSLATTDILIVASTSLANNAADAGPINIVGLASSEHLFFRGGAVEDSTTTYTVSSNYTATSSNFAQSTTAGGAAVTNMAARGEFRIVIATSDTTDPITSVADQASVYFALKESTGVATAGSFARGYRLTLCGVGA